MIRTHKSGHYLKKKTVWFLPPEHTTEVKMTSELSKKGVGRRNTGRRWHKL